MITYGCPASLSGSCPARRSRSGDEQSDLPLRRLTVLSVCGAGSAGGQGGIPTPLAVLCAVAAAGRLGKLNIQGTDIILGKPFLFTAGNIDQFDF